MKYLYFHFVRDYLQDGGLAASHRVSDSMFQDKEGNEVLEFPCIRGFPLESMHLIDGGVIKEFMQELVACCSKASDNDQSEKTQKRRPTYSIIETELEDAIKFYRPFSLSDQNRKLR